MLKIHDEFCEWKLGKSFAAALNNKTEPLGLAEKTPTEAPATDKAANDGKRRSSVHSELLPSTGLILRGNKKDVKRTTDLIRQIEQRGLKPAASDKNDQKAGQTQQTRQVMVYQLHGLDLDPQSVRSLLRALLAEVPEVRMEVDLKTDSLIVWASPSVHTAIREILELLPQRDAEPLPKPSSHATTSCRWNPAWKLRDASHEPPFPPFPGGEWL